MSFAVGMDLSLLQHIEDHGVKYKNDGRVQDPLQIFGAYGVSFVRLRLFVHPNGQDGQVNDLPYTLRLAKRVKDAGFSLLLDLHYSDRWADPQGQAIPPAWRGLSEAALTQTVEDYTADVLTQFGTAGCLPDMLQVGNEITNGMLWPTGRLTPEGGWETFAGLLRAGIHGAREGGYAGNMMIHIDQGGNQEVCRWFYDNLQQFDVPFAIIGLSYYPFWHGTLADLIANLHFLAERYGKDIIVVETGTDWRGSVGADFPSTPEGQKNFLQAVFAAVRATPGGRGVGVFYWQPEWINGAKWNGPEWSKVWESRALFAPDGNALPALQAFRETAHLDKKTTS